MSDRRSVTFTVPLTPPSVNHYVQHGYSSRQARFTHTKTDEAKGWERDFPLFARQEYVISKNKRFSVAIEITFAPNERGDIDNFPKCVLDAIAKNWMLRAQNLEVLSDACIKILHVVIKDSPEDRTKGPQTTITIEAL